MYHIIIAGGIGSRFWPISRKKNPKQFLQLLDNESLIQRTYNRILKISDSNKIFILAPKEYKKHIKDQFPDFNVNNLLLEPSPQNTAPAIYLAAWHIFNIDKDAIVGIYPSDHHIHNDNEFINCVNEANYYIKQNIESIITLGIAPTYPSSSYGYININQNQKLKDRIYKVNQFLEKPSTVKAQKLIKDKNNLWNSGMFFFNVQTMNHEIEFHVPKIKKLVSKINSINEINKIWKDMPKNSIDYAVMEKTSKSYCIKSSLQWSDLGTWVSLFNLLPKDENGNVIKGNVINFNSSDLNSTGTSSIIVANCFDNNALSFPCSTFSFNFPFNNQMISINI